MPKKLALTKASAKPAARVAPLLADVRSLILAAREQVARAVDFGLVTLYWHVGRRVYQDILKEKRAEYGAEIVATLSRQLEKEFGRGFAEKNVRRMVQFAQAFADERIVATLRRQLGWSHFKEIIPLQDELQRDFYAEMCRIERWSVRTLRQKVGSMLFERTALSRKPDKLIRQELAALREEDKLTPDLVFRDRANWGRGRRSSNPKGIVSSSPGLRGTSYPGSDAPRIPTPTGLHQVWVAEPQPRRGCLPSATFPRVARTSQPWASSLNPFGIPFRNFRNVLGLVAIARAFA